MYVKILSFDSLCYKVVHDVRIVLKTILSSSAGASERVGTRRCTAALCISAP